MAEAVSERKADQDDGRPNDLGEYKQETYTEEDIVDFEKQMIGFLERKTNRTTLLRVVSAECAQIQHDEFIALRAIFENDLALVDSESKCFKITLVDKSTEHSDDEVLDIWFSIPADYPNVPPIFELEGHGALSVQQADELYDTLIQSAISRVPSTMLYDLIVEAKEFLSHHIMKRKKIKESTLQGKKKRWEVENKDQDDGDLEDTVDYESAMNLRPSNFTGPLHTYLGKIPSSLQVASVENILRLDLAERFLKQERYFNTKYFNKGRRNRMEYELTRTLGFHGTSQDNVRNIVRSGLVIPGNNNSVRVAHGSCYGLGIYLSPDPEYSYGYCDTGGTVLVCSVLLGHMYKEYRTDSEKGNYDSFIVNNGKEIVVFNPAQVLPCYLIRLVPRGEKENLEDLHSETRKMIDIKSETVKERQERLKARAAKFLPYGFGPSSKNGPKMVVEDVADSDDDEEEYGEYQKNFPWLPRTRHTKQHNGSMVKNTIANTFAASHLMTAS